MRTELTQKSVYSFFSALGVKFDHAALNLTTRVNLKIHGWDPPPLFVLFALNCTFAFACISAGDVFYIPHSRFYSKIFNFITIPTWWNHDGWILSDYWSSILVVDTIGSSMVMVYVIHRDNNYSSTCTAPYSSYRGCSVIKTEHMCHNITDVPSKNKCWFL